MIEKWKLSLAALSGAQVFIRHYKKQSKGLGGGLRKIFFLISVLFASVCYPETLSVLTQAPEIRAQLNAKYTTILSSEISSKITQLSVQTGDSFKKGQLLLAFNCAEQQAQLKKAKAVVQAAKKTYKVNQRLVKFNSISVLEVELAAAEVAKAKADIELVRAVLQKCRITAPYSGRVADRFVNRYQYVKAGEPVLDILDNKQLEVVLLVPSKWLTWIKPKMKFTIFIEENQQQYPASVDKIAARIDAVSQSIKIIGLIDGQFDDLLPGMSGRVLFPNPNNIND